MRIAGRFRYDAAPEVVYALFTHRDALLHAVVGLQSLEELGPDRWAASIRVGLGGFALRYEGTVAITHRDPPHGFKLQIAAATDGGGAEVAADLRFLPDGSGCVVAYDADFRFHGAQRLQPALARGLVDFFLHGMKEHLERPRRNRKEHG